MALSFVLPMLFIRLMLKSDLGLYAKALTLQLFFVALLRLGSGEYLLKSKGNKYRLTQITTSLCLHAIILLTPTVLIGFSFLNLPCSLIFLVVLSGLGSSIFNIMMIEYRDLNAWKNFGVLEIIYSLIMPMLSLVLVYYLDYDVESRFILQSAVALIITVMVFVKRGKFLHIWEQYRSLLNFGYKIGLLQVLNAAFILILVSRLSSVSNNEVMGEWQVIRGLTFILPQTIIALIDVYIQDIYSEIKTVRTEWYRLFTKSWVIWLLGLIIWLTIPLWSKWFLLLYAGESYLALVDLLFLGFTYSFLMIVNHVSLKSFYINGMVTEGTSSSIVGLLVAGALILGMHNLHDALAILVVKEFLQLILLNIYVVFNRKGIS
jgi:hypothetical protein